MYDGRVPAKGATSRCRVVDIRHRGGQTMSYFSKRALRWAAPVALVGALGLAACGNSDDTEAVRVAAPSAVGVGSDQHLANKAEELARVSAVAGSDQHLSNKAEELAQEQRAFRAASVGSDQHLNNRAAEIASQRANRAASARLTGQAEQMQRAEAARLAAQAEQVERSAHLEGQANTYSGIDVPTNSDANLPNVFEAGNRAAQAALAEQYVEQLQDRADGNRDALMAQAEQYVEQQQDRADSNRSFLPGSHHVPTQ
jgi:hypothetical protein